MVNFNTSAANAFLHKLTSGLTAIVGLAPTVLASLSNATIVIPHSGADWATLGIGILGLFAHSVDAKKALTK